MVLGAIAMALLLVVWLVRRKRQGKAVLIDPGLFELQGLPAGDLPSQMLQQIALGGTMIALPIYLQMVLEYDAMEAGLSLAPLSLTMFAIAILAGRRSGKRAAKSQVIRLGFGLLAVGIVVADPDRAAGRRPAGTCCPRW